MADMSTTAAPTTPAACAVTAGPTYAQVAVPHEARGQWPELTEAGHEAIQDVMAAANGFYYPGDRSDAIAAALAWLQRNPAACAALRLGEPQ